MSEETEPSDTLCATEDALGSFQANVSYKEEEFITLSDLVSPPAKIDIKMELPNVTLESIGKGENIPSGLDNRKSVQEIKENTDGNIDLILKPNQSNETYEYLTIIDSIGINIEKADFPNNCIETKQSSSSKGRRASKIKLPTQNVTVLQKSKRGRPRKIQPSTNEKVQKKENPNNNTCVDTTPLKVPMKVITKRGRKSKGDSTKCASHSNSIEKVDNVEIVSSTINDSLLIEVKPSRGRRRKNYNMPVQSKDMSHDIINTDELGLCPKKKSKCGSKGRKKKCVKSKMQDSESDINSTQPPAIFQYNNSVNGSLEMTDTKVQNDVVDSSSLLVENQQDDEETDDICLSKLKSKFDVHPHNNESRATVKDHELQKEPNSEEKESDLKLIEGELNKLNSSEPKRTITKRKPKKPVMEDFEYNIDNVVSKTEVEMKDDAMENTVSELGIQDSSKRLVRRRTKQTFKYDEESDEDPFAHVELFDDEPHTSKKNRYSSDDEYIPGQKDVSPESSSDSSVENIEFDCDEKQRKRRFKKLDKSDKSNSPRKVKKRTISTSGNNSKTDSDIVEIDIEDSLKRSVLIVNSSNSWESSDKITDYLAKRIQGTDIKIIKANPSASPVAKFEIPVLDPNEPKKFIENATQTNTTTHISEFTQTDSQHKLAMNKQVNLSSEQSKKACEFLKSIVETTAELGELMTQKSRDFIAKKINTTNVTDTQKMDYCVRKSFLLFKLAKHNLMQMEQDLETKYEEFLEANNLLQYRESKKIIKPQQDTKDDSDCEIVEEITPAKPKAKPIFNPKTVFLNKELSIKIAKNPKSTENPNVRGRHTVWINDSVMVKKVQPMQSFLAQDSRNKKPPDYITLEMLKNCLDDYYREQKVLSICRPYTSPEWLSVKHNYVCNYFVKNATDFESGINENLFTQSESNIDPAANTYAVKIKATTSHGYISPKALLTICTESIQKHLHVMKQDIGSTTADNVVKNKSILPNEMVCRSSQLKSHLLGITTNAIDGRISSLKTICIVTINQLLAREALNVPRDTRNIACETVVTESSMDNINIIKIASLSKLCCKIIQKYFVHLAEETTSYSVSSLSSIALQVLNKIIIKKTPPICAIKENQNSELCEVGEDAMALTINCVSTVTEEAFSNFQSPEYDISPYIDHNYEDDTGFVHEDYDSDTAYTEQPNLEDSSWVSKVQMQELCSFVLPSSTSISTSLDISEKNKEIVSSEQPLITQIKIEPEDIDPEMDMIKVKTELPDEEEVPVPLVNFMTKQEHIEEISGISTEPRPLRSPQSSNTYEADLFESFVRSNKIIRDISASYFNEDEIFSQSSQRVKRQYEPDSDDETNTSDNLGLLVPQSVVIAKDQLMENSSDEGSNKKQERKKRAKSLKSKKIVKDIVSKDKAIIGNEVAVLTKKMKERIRKEERKKESSDSEMDETVSKDKFPVGNGVLKRSKKELMRQEESKNESADQKTDNTVAKDESQVGNDIPILTRKMKEKIQREEKKDKSSGSETEETVLQSRRLKQQIYEETIAGEEKKNERKVGFVETQEKNINTEKEIQCSEVDSTEFFNPGTSHQENSISKRKSKLKKIETSAQEDAQNQFMENICLDFDPSIPPELLECEPEISIEDVSSKKIKDRTKLISTLCVSNESNNNKAKFAERHGWLCYSIDPNDRKIYENASVVLEKLPESFVETYFRFQEISKDSDDDAEVNRLTNLTSLSRSLSKDKSRTRPKDEINMIIKHPKLGVDNISSQENIDDHYAEFEPSEDDDDRPKYMQVPQMAPHNVDNCMAKNLLMDDNESDSEQIQKQDGYIKIKQEPGTEVEPKKITRAGPKSKTKMGVKPSNSGESVMLTVDIMMNSELAQLNTPVVMEVEREVFPEVKDVEKPVAKKSARIGEKKKKLQNKLNIKQEDELSSEEEKQWVFTKEKLLKRIEKKQETAVVDEVKGAKRVSEFIEKRGEASEQQKQRPPARGRKKSKKKLLERRKQMKILARELFGEQLSSKKCSQNYSKGRRNIRKVLNKQSLNHATIVANKEEFERKRRLINRQGQLREHLGCEEGVNVVVINDELCLEYDFVRNVPIVGVHKFFTKVMKAHQYEGVKFMWDACFESVSHVARGDPGGGCILAHCMGLGKTLQVLALLHTALTHPMLNMRRVLVCCPLSTVLNWVDEIHKWIDPVTDKIKTFELSKLKRTYERAYQLEDWYNNGGIFIIGYELFRTLTTLDSEIDNVRPAYIKKIRTALLDPGPDIIVCDEGHLLKNDCSVLAVAMSRVLTRRRIVLTGTPMQNNLREYYCMVNFVKPSLLGTYSEYSNRFENPIMNGQHRDSRQDDIILMKTRTHILHKVLEGCLQRQEASVLYPYLPKKYEYTVFIPLTKCQTDMYKHYLHCYASKGKQSVLKDFHILQKIWTHPQVLHNFQTRAREAEDKKIKAEKIEDDLAQEDIAASVDIKPAQTEVWWLQYLEGGNMLHALESSNKFHVVFQLLDEFVALGDKVLIFSTSLYTMDALEHFLKHRNKWSLGQEYYRLDGSVPAEVRQKWCREFNAENNDRTKLFLISTRAGCLGLNMTAANRVIILDTSWNPAHDIQSIFRVYRFGQKKDCYIYRLVAMGTMEQKIYERSVTKQAVSCRVVDEQQIDRHFNSADLTELYSWDSDGWGVLAGMAASVRDAALLRVAAGGAGGEGGAGALHAVREHDSLLRGSEPALPEHERAAAWQAFQLEHVHPALPHAAEASVASSVLEQIDDHNGNITPIPNLMEATTSTSNGAWGANNKLKKRKNSQAKKKTHKPPTPQVEPPQNEPSDKEELLVKKIMKILIDNKFHESIQDEDLTTLIRNVRKLVSSRMMDVDLLNDPIATGIASVLLQDNDDMHNDINVQDDIPDSDTIVHIETNYKYNASCEPEQYRSEDLLKQIEDEGTQSCDVVDNVDITCEDNDVEWTPDSNDLQLKSREKKKPKRKKSCRDKRKEEFKNTQKLSQEDNEFASSNTADSIVISDDDEIVSEPLAVSPIVPEKEKLKNTKKSSKKREIVEEKVPLHPLILANENFIKIVAHMYQRGNTVLSDDAAKMAAQYSTTKARSEYEATGVPITSGSLYEIAIESLGVDQLKKMNQSIHPMAIGFPPQPSTSKEAPKEDDEIEFLDTVCQGDTEKKRKISVRSKSRNNIKESAPAPPQPPEILPEPLPQNVFPVGMFIGPAKASQPQPVQVIEECILPDDEDDDIVINSTVQTPQVGHLAARPLDKSDLWLRNYQPQIDKTASILQKNLTVGTSGKLTTAQTEPTSKLIISIDSGIPSVPVAECINQSQLGHEPICLSDSDDETPIQPPPPPHPIALINPTGPPPNVIQTATDTTPKVPPIVLQAARFKGGTPFILSSGKKVRDPNKKYYCVPSPLYDANSPNSIVPDAIPVEENRPKSNKQSLIVITNLGEVKCGGGSPQEPTKKGDDTPYTNISNSTRKQDRRSISDANDGRSNQGQIYSSISGTSNTAIMTTPTISKNNALAQDNQRVESPSPPIDHVSLFKDVVQIQANTYKDVQKKERSTTKIVNYTSLAKNVKESANISKQDSLKPTSSKDRPAMTPKSSTATSYSIKKIPIFLSSTSPAETRKQKLLVLKKMEKDKFDNAKGGTASMPNRASKVISVDRSAGKNIVTESFIDLTDIPEKKPKTDKRPAPYIEKPVKKQKSRLTLADFDLDDTDDILELG